MVIIKSAVQNISSKNISKYCKQHKQLVRVWQEDSVRYERRQ
jgi:hypothetical protein